MRAWSFEQIESTKDGHLREEINKEEN